MNGAVENLPDSIQIQSATLCIVVWMPALQLDNTALDKMPQRYESRYYDTGEIKGWSLFRKVSEQMTERVLKPLEVFVSPPWDKSKPYDVRIAIDPATVPTLFQSRDFDGWDESVRLSLEASLNQPLDNNWKQRCGFVLVVEDTNLTRLPVDAEKANTYAKQWLQFLGADNTVAYPFRFGETIFISAPHVMGVKPIDRVLCAITRPHPTTITSENLALAYSVESLLSCWAGVIAIEAVREELAAAALFGTSVTEYLGKLGWHKTRRKRMAQYEEQYLKDRENALDLVVNARRALVTVENNLQFNPCIRLRETAIVLPIGKPSSSAYSVAGLVASTIDTPLIGVANDITELEMREKGLSEYLRDAASAHIERANWNIQWIIIVLTIATILFGAASLYLDWKTYLSSLDSTNQPKGADKPPIPAIKKTEPSNIPAPD